MRASKIFFFKCGPRTIFPKKIGPRSRKGCRLLIGGLHAVYKLFMVYKDGYAFYKTLVSDLKYENIAEVKLAVTI